MKEQQHNSKALRVWRACLVDRYLSKVSRYGNLALGKFQVLAELLPESARMCHDDGLYRAVVPESASGGDGARAVDCDFF